MDPGALGRRLAQGLRAGKERPDVRALASGMGVEIVERAAPPPAQPGLRSEYRPDPPRIILYRNRIDEGAARARADGRFELGGWGMDEVHVAHELFHHLERAEQGAPLPVGEGEDAAHAFARELLGLAFDPRELPEAGG